MSQTRVTPPDEKIDRDIITLLKEKNITKLLGGGGESWVYLLDTDNIIRICKDRINNSQNKLCPFEYALRKKKFYDSMHKYKFPFSFCKIESVNRKDNIVFTIEKRIHGISLHEAFITYPDKRQVLLKNYFNAVKTLDIIELPQKEFGVLLTTDKTAPYTTKSTWPEYLFATILHVIKENAEFFIDNKININEPIINKIKYKIYSCFKNMNKHGLVHGDIFPPNIMIDPVTCQITGIIDFSDLTVVGDHFLDIASTLLQTEYLDPYGEFYSTFMKKIIYREYGNQLNEVINVYRLYYSFLFLTSKWSMNNLKNIVEILETKSLWSPFYEEKISTKRLLNNLHFFKKLEDEHVQSNRHNNAELQHEYDKRFGLIFK